MSSTTIEVPNCDDPRSGYAVFSEEFGVLTISKCKRSNSGATNVSGGYMTLAKHQQIALRDMLCKRWGTP